ncbi:MAG: DUF192 domain-containing protein [Candidatus Levybacteria bacterium]|nr:DUF192 domain-containing protein [Candidatus Levybacteria bacterium]MBP9814913.1 DUF192 domain-containing protein [Candidatus Levybacteria bacterium]
MKKVLMFYGLLVIVVILFMLTRGTNLLNFGGVSGNNSTTATIGDTTYKLLVVKTETDKQKGLSDRNNLSKDSGMLFLFQEKSKPSFWMKNMKFPIDILFISDSKIVDIVENAKVLTADQDATTLPIYKPAEDSNSVLEINAGEVKKNKIKKGDTVTFKGVQ